MSIVDTHTHTQHIRWFFLEISVAFYYSHIFHLYSNIVDNCGCLMKEKRKKATTTTNGLMSGGYCYYFAWSVRIYISCGLRFFFSIFRVKWRCEGNVCMRISAGIVANRTPTLTFVFLLHILFRLARCERETPNKKKCQAKAQRLGICLSSSWHLILGHRQKYIIEIA